MLGWPKRTPYTSVRVARQLSANQRERADDNCCFDVAAYGDKAAILLCDSEQEREVEEDADVSFDVVSYIHRL